MDYEWKMNVNPLDYTTADTAEVLELGTKIWYYNYGDYDGYVSVVGDGVSTLDALDKLYARNDEIDKIATIESTYGLGVDQTWKSIASVRFSGTTYTNSHNKPIAVSIIVISSSAKSYLYVDGILESFYDPLSTGTRGSLFAIVPSGSEYYLTNTSGFDNWNELY